MIRASGALLVGLVLTLATEAHADAESDRASAWGYFRISTRPDFQGGNGALGFWNLYGRLLNEGQYAELNLGLKALQNQPGTDDPWADVKVRLACTSYGQTDPGNGSFVNCRISQFFVEAGNVLLSKVTWRLGTQEYYHGDLGLYDFRPTNLFTDMIGLSADYKSDRGELLFVLGDAGYSLRGSLYNTVLVGGAVASYRPTDHFDIGIGGELRYEPKVTGDRNAPYYTPGISYEDFIRHEVILRFLEEHPGQENFFTQPVATDANSWELMGFFEFGDFGPLRWNKLQANLQKLHPQNVYQETFQGRTYDIFLKALTDQKYQVNAGDQAEITVLPGKLDLLLSGWLSYALDKDNEIAPSDDNRLIWSVLGRAVYYITPTFHWLTEAVYANEHSLNGNAYRDHADSIFRSTNGVSDTRGLEFGDDDTRRTTQLKFGFTLNPTGKGIFARPELRLLYGLQYSTQQAAYGSGFNTDLSQFNNFASPERHWHSVIALEAEGWF
jgi:hypothetical protein